jgi:hypothetical protein
MGCEPSAKTCKGGRGDPNTSSSGHLPPENVSTTTSVISNKEETTISIRSVNTENMAVEDEKIPRNLS